jgi:hypothetical protein
MVSSAPGKGKDWQGELMEERKDGGAREKQDPILIPVGRSF